jgi:hypothetical protein
LARDRNEAELVDLETNRGEPLMVAAIETLSPRDARRLLAAADAKAAQIGVPSNIAEG